MRCSFFPQFLSFVYLTLTRSRHAIFLSRITFHFIVLFFFNFVLFFFSFNCSSNLFMVVFFHECIFKMSYRVASVQNVSIGCCTLTHCFCSFTEYIFFLFWSVRFSLVLTWRTKNNTQNGRAMKMNRRSCKWSSSVSAIAFHVFFNVNSKNVENENRNFFFGFFFWFYFNSWRRKSGHFRL